MIVKGKDQQDTTNARYGSVLIVGGDSVVGTNLVKTFRMKRANVITTTRRVDKLDKATVWLDLLDVNATEFPSLKFDTAILCAGLTSKQQCDQDPQQSYKTNVDGIMHVVAKLAAQRAHIIYLSTNEVFSGSDCFPTHKADVNPMSIYGKLKAECESKIRSITSNLTIVRFTKIIHPKFPLFVEWVCRIKKRETIQPYCDKYFAPIPLDYAVNVILRLTSMKFPGIVHVSASRDISYYEAGVVIAKTLSRDINLVIPHRSINDDKDIPNLAKTALDTTTLKEIGFSPCDPCDTIKAWALKYNTTVV